MNVWQFILVFGAGIALGIIMYPLARMMESQGIDHFLDSLGRFVGYPFSLLGRLFRRIFPSRNVVTAASAAEPSRIDPREQQLSDTAQTIRGILLGLATVIQRADQAASDSSQALGDVRNTIDRIRIPDDLLEVHSLLLKEIDRVISSNSTLKRELDHSRETLATQRQQIENLKTAVRIDGMTQLANRACFDEKLTEMIRLRDRYEESFSLLMIDVDNFKMINDSHGHQGGDRVLKGVAFKIRATLRQTDFVARFGGDEFAAILLKAKADSAAVIAAKLCEQIRESRFLLDGAEVRTSLSIGVAEAVDGESEEELLKRADTALYRVKHSGRNGVAVAEIPGQEQDAALR
jgi:diguanylate cyclase